jgi:2-polyprenyl-3-methyl-5-hydroxy-6-metoxy-1,4-benzoquinol methylase/ribosomal protein S27E
MPGVDELARPLREADIRPPELMDEQARRFAVDVRQLNERRGDFVEVPCPACGIKGGTEIFRKYEQVFRRCDSCETVFVSPRPTAKIIAWYYSVSENMKYWAEHIFPSSEGARKERIFRPRARRVAEIRNRHGVGRGLMVDVGAGFGTFCEVMKEEGHFDRVIAIEPNPDVARQIRSRGIEVIEKPVEQVTLDNDAVDVVTSFEVIEHLFDPQLFLRECGTILRPGGLLIATCPNVKGFDVQMLGPPSTTFDVEHLNYFHPASLSHLAASCGFEILEVSTPGELDADIVRQAVAKGAISVEGNPLFEDIFVKRWDALGAQFQAFLSANGLSSHMWLVARKN